MKIYRHWWLAATLAFGSGNALAADNCPYKGKTQYIRAGNWQAMCHCPGEKSKAEASCTAASRSIGEVTIIYGTTNVISVRSTKSGARSLSWKPRFYRPDGAHPVNLQIDDLPGYRLTPGRGYTVSRETGEVSLGQSAWVNEVLPALKAGHSLHLRYTDQFGDPQHATLSLAGLTRTMKFVDNRLGIKEPVAAAQPAVVKPAAKPVAKAAAKPAAVPAQAKAKPAAAKAPVKSAAKPDAKSSEPAAKVSEAPAEAEKPAEEAPKKSAFRALFE